MTEQDQNGVASRETANRERRGPNYLPRPCTETVARGAGSTPRQTGPVRAGQQRKLDGKYCTDDKKDQSKDELWNDAGILLANYLRG